ncbi:MAG: carboxypeptidase-like regulatory domain-containing protein [Dysgonomonas sp.]
MSKYLLYIALVLSPFFLSAQTAIHGVVRDTIDNKPINGVVVSIIDNDEDIIGYGLTNSKGFYQIEIDSQNKELELTVSFLGYKQKVFTIRNNSQVIDVALQPSEIQLKEVVIKSEVMWSREDTLIYSVGAFRSQQDRTIGDILKKLPGIEVSQNGGIKYNGEPINKFYIEGMDLLDKKYGIATNNVPVDAVTNVEVIENHQPVKALKDLMSTGQAAINLKLQDSKMARPVGTAKVGIGGIKDLLWNIDAFVLQANRKHQAIAMYKTNNTGNNIATELTEHSLFSEDLSKHKTISGLLTDNVLNNPPIEENRYLFNKTHIATLNSLWKTGEDSQLRLNINYLHDALDESIYQNSSYFLPENSLQIDEQRNAYKKNNYIDGTITYTDNTSRHYISNILKGQAKWNEASLNIENANRIMQKFNTPEYLVSNDLQYVKKWNNRIWDISSFVRYASLPQYLRVDIDTLKEDIIQKTNQNGLYTNNSSNFSFSKGNSRLYLNLNMEGYIENLNSDLSNHPILTDSTSSKIRANYFKIIINPSYYFKKKKIEFSINVPITYHWLESQDKMNNRAKSEDFLYLDSKVKLTYKINQLWETSFLYRYNHNIGDITDFADSYIISDYRTVNVKAGILQKRESQSVNIRVNFRNPLTTMFFNTSIAYTSFRRNLLDEQYFLNKQSIISNSEHKNRYEMWMWRGYIGKYFGDIKTGFSLLANLNFIKSEKMQQGLLVPLKSTSWGLIPKINTKICDEFSASYQAEILNNRLQIDISSSSKLSTYQISQKLTGHYFLNSKIELDTQLEYLYNEITKSLSCNLIFANIGVKYKNKEIEYELYINNIFNKKEYSYTIYNSLDTYNYNYKLRPINVLGTVSFKF